MRKKILTIHKMSDGQIVCKVKVNRGSSPREMLNATRRWQYTSHKVEDSMPRGMDDEVEVVFFKPEPWEYTRPGWISDDDLEKALERRGLKNDPLAVVAVNEAEPAFADEYRHATHWKDIKGNWCFAIFGRWLYRRRVSINSHGGDWRCDRYWFAGVRLPVLPYLRMKGGLGE